MLWFYDYWYIVLVLPAVLLAAFASFSVNSTFKKFSRQRSSRGITGAEAARRVLDAHGLYSVQIKRVRGNLTDHYSPKEKVLRLSDSVYGSTSVAAIGVAAHECGHAIQHHTKYVPLTLRSASVPLANIGSFIYWPVIILGIILGRPELASFGVVLFGFVVLFQLITLPVEFDASNRAMKVMTERGILSGEELKCAGKVLGAAALTYVAALFNSILQLLRLVLLTRSRDD